MRKIDGTGVVEPREWRVSGVQRSQGVECFNERLESEPISFAHGDVDTVQIWVSVDSLDNLLVEE